MTKRSPPMPQLMGSTRPSMALAAMAASMADQSRSSTWAAASEASVWLVVAIQIAAVAAAHGLHQARHGVGDDGGIHGQSVALEHLGGGLGGERLAGGGDSVLGNHHGSRLGTFLAMGGHGNRQRGATECRNSGYKPHAEN